MTCTPSCWHRLIGERIKDANRECIRVHDTRRTCGSLLAALDVHPRVAMQILRHSETAITMEIYTMMPDQAILMGCRPAGRSACRG